MQLCKQFFNNFKILNFIFYHSSCRWRLHIRKALSPDQKPTSTSVKDAENEVKQDEDDKLLNEMEELAYAMERKKKRAKKLLAKRKAKVCDLSFRSLFSIHLGLMLLQRIMYDAL